MCIRDSHKARTELPVQAGLLEEYFERTRDPEKADAAIVFMAVSYTHLADERL